MCCHTKMYFIHLIKSSGLGDNTRNGWIGLFLDLWEFDIRSGGVSQKTQTSQQEPIANSPVYDVVIVGAGFAGLCMAIHLKKAGWHNFVVLEAAQDVGGTWRDNTYPGCACDVPSHLYSYSFEPRPDWSSSFGSQWEILEYIRHCVQKYELTSHIRFSALVVNQVFQEQDGLWRITTQDGRTFFATVVVGATGPLNKPAYPNIPGREVFSGPQFHSSLWDHNVSLTGKRVAVIGTGASAIQIVPAIAPEVQQLSLFQRTPPWILPRQGKVFPRWVKRMFSWFPFLQWLYRASIYWRLEVRGFGFVTYPNMMNWVSRMAKRFIDASIADPALRKKVTPTYTIGCKRVLLSDDYYPALTRDNVALITSNIREIREHSILCEDGSEHPVDVIVYATGFNVYDFLGPITVTGLEGRDLATTWSERVESYYGLAVSGFPNFFYLLGPNTGLGHNSVIFMIEAQVHYLMQCLSYMREHEVRSLNVKPEIQAQFFADIQRRMQKTVWLSGGCRSWYLTEDGQNYTLWPGYTAEYWLKMRRFQPQDFEQLRDD